METEDFRPKAECCQRLQSRSAQGCVCTSVALLRSATRHKRRVPRNQGKEEACCPHSAARSKARHCPACPRRRQTRPQHCSCGFAVQRRRCCPDEQIRYRIPRSCSVVGISPVFVHPKFWSRCRGQPCEI